MLVDTIIKLHFPCFGVPTVFSMNNIVILVTLVVIMNFQRNQYHSLLGCIKCKNFVILLILASNVHYHHLIFPL